MNDCVLWEKGTHNCTGLTIRKCTNCAFYKNEEMEKESAEKCIKRQGYYVPHTQMTADNVSTKGIILEIVKKEQSTEEIAKQLGMKLESVRAILNRLWGKELVRSRKQGDKTFWRAI